MCKILKHETYGYPTSAWQEAKGEATRAIIHEARRGFTIFYSDLTKRIGRIGFDPHDYAFHHLLGETFQLRRTPPGRGMLSALVVHKEDGMPGQGFFDLAQDLDRNITDKVRCWSEEVKTVLGHCQDHPLAA